MQHQNSTIMKTNFPILFLALFLFQISCKEAPKEPLPPPNIIFIMTDDHANNAMSAYSTKLIETPNMDRIGKEGIKFTNSFVTNSICAPSRAVLLTGRYSHLNGLRDNRDHFDGNQMNFPKILQQTGYQTSVVGKWHLKTAPTGFDYWNVLIGQGPYYNPKMVENGDTIDHEGYTTDIITDLALNYLEKRDTTKPFCMLYHHKAPHRNWMPHPKYFDLYKDLELPLPETFYDDYSTRSKAASDQDQRIEHMYLSHDMKLLPEDWGGGKDPGTGGSGGSHDAGPGHVASMNRLTPEQRAAWDAHYDEVRKYFRESNLEGKELLEWKYQRYIKDYLRCVKSVDDNIGRVLDYLDENGLTENTLVVYTSDQGFYLGEHGWYDKRFMYEESLRMPLVMRYPALTKPSQTVEKMVLNLDFAPTFLDLAGAAIPTDFQGQSLKPFLENETPDDWRSSFYYQYYEYPHGWHLVKKHYGVRTETYKLIHFYDDIDSWELFDLQADPNELNNVFGQENFAEIQSNLEKELAQLKKDLKVPEG